MDLEINIMNNYNFLNPDDTFEGNVMKSIYDNRQRTVICCFTSVSGRNIMPVMQPALIVSPYLNKESQQSY